VREDLRAAGVRALANAGNENWFFGHLGACVVAGHAMLNDFDLSDPVRDGVASLADHIVDGNPQRFGDAGAGAMCEPKAVLKAIGDCIGTLHNSGHGIIYATLGLRAMAEDAALCTTAHCDGIARLTVAANDDSPQRYYGFEDYSTVVPTAEQVPEFDTPTEALAYAIEECEHAWSDAQIKDRRYFFNGEKIHGVTYSWALCELEQLGHSELATRGLGIARQMLLLNRQQPPAGAKPSPPARWIPTDAEFWTSTTDPFHALKLAYAALCAAEKLDRPQEALLRSLSRIWSISR
jgi:hypothetical protein